jgi:hypothetical protein
VARVAVCCDAISLLRDARESEALHDLVSGTSGYHFDGTMVSPDSKGHSVSRRCVNDCTNPCEFCSDKRCASVGALLFNKYSNSVVNLLKALFPDHSWVPWKFEKAPKGTWRDPKIVRDYCLDFANKKNISNMEQWYDVEFQELASSSKGIVPLFNVFFFCFFWRRFSVVARCG